jgi:hypothetical protein
MLSHCRRPRSPRQWGGANTLGVRVDTGDATTAAQEEELRQAREMQAQLRCQRAPSAAVPGSSSSPSPPPISSSSSSSHGAHTHLNPIPASQSRRLHASLAAVPASGATSPTRASSAPSGPSGGDSTRSAHPTRATSSPQASPGGDGGGSGFVKLLALPRESSVDDERHEHGKATSSDTDESHPSARDGHSVSNPGEFLLNRTLQAGWCHKCVKHWPRTIGMLTWCKHSYPPPTHTHKHHTTRTPHKRSRHRSTRAS